MRILSPRRVSGAPSAWNHGRNLHALDVDPSGRWLLATGDAHAWLILLVSAETVALEGLPGPLLPHGNFWFGEGGQHVHGVASWRARPGESFLGTWNTATGALEREDECPAASVLLCVSADRAVGVLRCGPSLTLQRLGAANVVGRFTTASENDAAFLGVMGDDGRTLFAAISKNGAPGHATRIVKIDTRSGHVEAESEKAAERVKTLALVDAGRRLLVSQWYTGYPVLVLRTSDLEEERGVGSGGRVAASVDGERFSVSATSTVVYSSRTLAELETRSRSDFAVWLPDGRLVLASSGRITVPDGPVSLARPPFDADLLALGGAQPARSPDGRYLLRHHADTRVWGTGSNDEGDLLSGEDQSFEVETVSTGERRSWRHPPGPRPSYQFTFAPHGTLVVSGDSAYYLDVWDLETCEVRVRLRALEIDAPGTVRGLSWSPDGMRIVAGGSGGWIAHWDAATGELLRVVEGEAPVVAVAVDRRHVAVAREEEPHRLTLHDAKSLDLLAELTGALCPPKELRFTQEGRLLVGGAADSRILEYDLD